MSGRAGSVARVAVLGLIAIELLGTVCRLLDAAGLLDAGRSPATLPEGLAEIGLLVTILVSAYLAASRFTNSLTKPWLLAPVFGGYVLATYYSHHQTGSCGTCRYSTEVPEALGWTWGFAVAALLVGAVTLRWPRLGLAGTAFVALLALGTLAFLGISTSDG